MRPRLLLLALWAALASGVASAQTPTGILDALEFRAVGPGLTSGRIADVAVDPRNRSIWYVATAGGGLWKTTNRGLTFTSIFDHHDTYTTCCVLVDPRNSSIGGDGFQPRVDPTDPNTIYAMSQDANIARLDKRIGTARSIRLPHV